VAAAQGEAGLMSKYCNGGDAPHRQRQVKYAAESNTPPLSFRQLK